MADRLPVTCDEHGPVVQAYIVCVHVLNNADGPPPDGLGEVLCARCHAASPHVSLEDLKVICATCVDRLLSRQAFPPAS